MTQDRYAATLARVRGWGPVNFPALKLILDDFGPRTTPNADAHFPDRGTDTLRKALADVGWEIRSLGSRSHYEATHSRTGASIVNFAGDIYNERRRRA